MYQTYKNEEVKRPTEKLVPKEITCDKREIDKSPLKNSKSLFGNLDNEDIIILGLLLVLYFEDCKDNMLMIILVALLFIKD